jgi:hypothetical protein
VNPNAAIKLQQCGRYHAPTFSCLECAAADTLRRDVVEHARRAAAASAQVAPRRWLETVEGWQV